MRVVGRRDDGYHDLEMVMVPLTLADRIELRSIASGIEIEVGGATDAGMAGERNLAWRAARALADAAGVESGVAIRLDKEIPIAAGLGGGSSDAAAVLRGLNKLWDIGWPVKRLASIGAGLGADVPFFCFEGPAFVEGIGDRVTVYDQFPNISFLLINPGFSVSTPWVYNQWDNQNTPSNIKWLTVNEASARVPPASAVARGRPVFHVLSDVIALLHNDLESVTIERYPEIGKIKDILRGAGARGVLMSGSGPTVFGIFEGSCARDKAAAGLNGGDWQVFAAESISGSQVGTW